MTRRGFVHIVCSPRPRVGKTLVARLLVEYFRANGRPCVAFDTNSNDPTLADALGEGVTITDIRTVQGQVALIDGLLLSDRVPKVVDLWHRVHDQFFNLAEEIGFIEEAARNTITPLLFFIDDGDGLTLEVHAKIRERFHGLMIVSVRNEGALSAAAHVAPRPDQATLFPFEPQLHIAPLDPILRRAIDTPGFSFSAFLREPSADMSIVVRAAVRAWTAKIFVQLQNLELRLSLLDAEYLR
jgi:hypothetical protein